MSENSSERYVDPNSGAAPQPGGFVAGGASNVIPDDQPEAVDLPKTDSDADATYQAAQEHSAGPAGEQPGGTSDPDGAVDAQPEADGGTEDSSAQAQAEDGSDGGSDDSSGAKDYSDLLEKNVPDVQKYIDEHPEEKDAVQAAEIDRAGDDARKGILEY